MRGKETDQPYGCSLSLHICSSTLFFFLMQDVSPPSLPGYQIPVSPATGTQSPNHWVTLTLKLCYPLVTCDYLSLN